LHLHKETKTAISTLRRAISLAEPSGFIRIFANEGQTMAYLLSALVSEKTTHSSYIETLIDATYAEHTPPIQSIPCSPHSRYPQVLSTREIEVLTLLATGASNQDIAERLIIAPTTVKRHVKHILAKLRVTNRTQAVTHAYDLHLL
jgi:LuxR family maltose regulon positive regulatory protein